MAQYKLFIWIGFLSIMVLSWSCQPEPRSCQCPLLSKGNIILLDSAEIEDVETNSSRAYIDSGKQLQINLELEKLNLESISGKGTLILPFDVWGSRRYFRQVKVFSSANASNQYLKYSRWYCFHYLALIDPRNCLLPQKGSEQLFKQFQKDNYHQINKIFGNEDVSEKKPGYIIPDLEKTEPNSSKKSKPNPVSAPAIYEVQIEFPVAIDQIESIVIDPKPLKLTKGISCLFVQVNDAPLDYQLSIRSIEDDLYSLNFSYDVPLLLKSQFTKNR